MANIDHGAEEAKKYGISRSPKWPAVQKAHLELEPKCRCCGGSVGLQVHHIFPFHYCIKLGRPDLELDQRNLITLCETEDGHTAQDHHLLVGHLGDFQSSNLDVVQDAEHTFHGQTAAQIKASATWDAKAKKRLTPLDQMTPQEKQDFEKAMNSRFPLKTTGPTLAGA